MRLSRLHKRMLYCAFAALWGSGVLWLLFHYFFEQASDFGPRPHPLESWWLRLHGLAMFLMLVALGALIPAHGSLAWHVRRQRASGMVMSLMMAWLVGTGYALYYFVGDRGESWLPGLHWGIGLAVPLLLLMHLRRRRSAVARAWLMPPAAESPGTTGKTVHPATWTGPVPGRTDPVPRRRFGRTYRN